MSWQPIETAPKDGTLFLIYPNSDEHATASYSGGYFRLGCCGQCCEATHWMPLPEWPEGYD